MRKQDVLSFFKSQAEVARLLGITRMAVHQWPDVIPELRALQLQHLTGGKLRYEPEAYRSNDGAAA